MLDFLGDILNAILDLPYLVVSLLIESINGWIVIVAAIVSVALSVLPGFPEIPTLNGEVLSGVAWFLPIGPMLAVFSTFVVAFIVWLGVSIALRWGKAL